MARDTVRLYSPEGVEVRLEIAGMGRRILAAVVDAVLHGLVLAAVLVGLFLGLSRLFPRGLEDAGLSTRLGGLTSGLLVAAGILFVAVLFYGYHLFFELAWHGQTPGKRLLGLRVVRADGLPAPPAAIVVRNLLRLVDVLPNGYALGFFSCILTARRQRLGDLAAGTVVVREGRPRLPGPRPSGPEAPAGGASLLRTHALRLRDAELEPVRTFLSRRGELDPRRRRELALSLARATAARMGWPEPLPEDPAGAERWLESVLASRHGPGPS